MPEYRATTPHASPDEQQLAEALRDLPSPNPNAGGWARMEQSLKLRRAPPRHWWPQAAAAALVALAIIPFARHWRETVAVPPASTNSVAATSTNEVIQRNQVLEHTLNADVNRNVPQDGEAALASAELEDLIGMLDLELSAARDSDESQDLWQQRLVLMQQLASVRERGLLGVAANVGFGRLADASVRMD